VSGISNSPTFRTHPSSAARLSSRPVVSKYCDHQALFSHCIDRAQCWNGTRVDHDLVTGQTLLDDSSRQRGRDHSLLLARPASALLAFAYQHEVPRRFHVQLGAFLVADHDRFFPAAPGTRTALACRPESAPPPGEVRRQLLPSRMLARFLPPRVAPRGVRSPPGLQHYSLPAPAPVAPLVHRRAFRCPARTWVSRLRCALQNKKTCPLRSSHNNLSCTTPYRPSKPFHMSVAPSRQVDPCGWAQSKHGLHALQCTLPDVPAYAHQSRAALRSGVHPIKQRPARNSARAPPAIS
jgi:hypothetical protein